MPKLHFDETFENGVLIERKERMEPDPPKSVDARVEELETLLIEIGNAPTFAAAQNVIRNHDIGSGGV